MGSTVGGALLARSAADFSLIFEGSSAGALTQDSYRFEHGEIGSFEVFVVPVDPTDSSKQNYQVVFNRLLA